MRRYIITTYVPAGTYVQFGLLLSPRGHHVTLPTLGTTWPRRCHGGESSHDASKENRRKRHAFRVELRFIFSLRSREMPTKKKTSRKLMDISR